MLVSNSSGLYVAVKPTLETKIKLYEWAAPTGLLLDLDLHVTLLYSRKNFPVVLSPGILFAKPKHISSLGSAAVVLHLDSLALINRHNHFIAHGHTHDWEDYTPHITLKMSDFDYRKLPPILFDLTFDSEYQEELMDP
jgi:hypothetical protein